MRKRIGIILLMSMVIACAGCAGYYAGYGYGTYYDYPYDYGYDDYYYPGNSFYFGGTVVRHEGRGMRRGGERHEGHEMRGGGERHEERGGREPRR